MNKIVHLILYSQFTIFVLSMRGMEVAPSSLESKIDILNQEIIAVGKSKDQAQFTVTMPDTKSFHLSDTIIDNMRIFIPIFQSKTNLVELNNNSKRPQISDYLFSERSLQLFIQSCEILQQEIEIKNKASEAKINKNAIITLKQMYTALFNNSYQLNPAVLQAMNVDYEIKNHVDSVQLENRSEENKEIIKEYYSQYLLLHKDEIKPTYVIGRYLDDKGSAFFGAQGKNNFEHLIAFEIAYRKQKAIFDQWCITFRIFIGYQAIEQSVKDSIIASVRNYGQSLDTKKKEFQKNAHNAHSDISLNENEMITDLCKAVFFVFVSQYNDHEKDTYINNSKGVLFDVLFAVFKTTHEGLSLAMIQQFCQTLSIINPLLQRVLAYQVSSIVKQYPPEILNPLLEFLQNVLVENYQKVINQKMYDLNTIEAISKNIEADAMRVIRVYYVRFIKGYLEENFVTPDGLDEATNVVLDQLFNGVEYATFNEMHETMKAAVQVLFERKPAVAPNNRRPQSHPWWNWRRYIAPSNWSLSKKVGVGIAGVYSLYKLIPHVFYMFKKKFR